MTVLRVVETGRRVLGAGHAGYSGAGAGRRELACGCSVLAPASDSEVITTSAACSSEGRPSAASDNEVPAVMGRMNLCTQHHTVLSLERSLSISAVGHLHSSGSVLADSCVQGCTVCAHTFVRIMFYAQLRNVRLSTDHCFSVFQRATHTIVVLDTAGPWASEAYGLCRLRAYFCAHNLIRARSYGLMVLQIVASSMLQSQ